LAFFTDFFMTLVAVFFGGFAAFVTALAAFFTDPGVFLAAALRARLATVLTVVSASAPAAVASKSVI
jgi:hypothetical protein